MKTKNTTNEVKTKNTTNEETTTATGLRSALLETFDLLRAKKIETARAKEISNAAGKIIGTAKAQLEYAALRKEKPNIPFLK